MSTVQAFFVFQRGIKIIFMSNNDRGLSLDDKTKDYAVRNTRGQVNSLHEVTQLG